MTITLTKEFITAVETELKELNQRYPLEIYWDYRDELSSEQIAKIIEGNECEVEEDIWSMNQDHIWELESERLKEAFENVNTDDTLDYEDVRDELRDELLDYLYVDTNLKDLISRAGAINVRVEMLSNYDCINSHHFETYGGGGYEYQDSYFGDMVDALNLNPKKVKQMLIEKGIETFGSWRNKPYRDGKEYVSYEDFWQELENSCCGANLLTFMGTIDLTDYLNRDKEVVKVTVPKGNFCGLYSSFQGGGSVLEMELKKDFTVKLDTKNYFGYRMELDENSFGYSISDVYGMSQSGWGKSLTI